ncbi:hypothetical protein BH11PLA2_BH11PLA2_22800 [soil metagenome]
MAVIIDIANAVVATLNAGTFSQAFTAERHYLPRFELPDMATLRVSVVPKGITSTALDRKRDQVDYRIDVALQHKTGTDLATLDALMTLAEEIGDYLQATALVGYPQARCFDMVNEPIYAPEHLEEFRQFTSLMTFTYRVWR